MQPSFNWIQFWGYCEHVWFNSLITRSRIYGVAVGVQPGAPSRNFCSPCEMAAVGGAIFYPPGCREIAVNLTTEILISRLKVFCTFFSVFFFAVFQVPFFGRFWPRLCSRWGRRKSGSRNWRRWRCSWLATAGGWTSPDTFSFSWPAASLNCCEFTLPIRLTVMPNRSRRYSSSLSNSSKGWKIRKATRLDIASTSSRIWLTSIPSAFAPIWKTTPEFTALCSCWSSRRSSKLTKWPPERFFFNFWLAWFDRARPLGSIPRCWSLLRHPYLPHPYTRWRGVSEKAPAPRDWAPRSGS